MEDRIGQRKATTRTSQARPNSISSMAPNALLLSTKMLNPIFLPLSTKTVTPRKPSPITCQTSSSSSASPPPPPLSVEPEGSGAAAPTRGDRFLERHNSTSAAALVIKKKDGTRYKKKKPEAKASSAVSCCYGCGAPLQTTEVDAPGYVDSGTYELVTLPFHPMMDWCLYLLLIWEKKKKKLFFWNFMCSFNLGCCILMILLFPSSVI